MAMYLGRCWGKEKQTTIIWRKTRFYVFFCVISKTHSLPPALSPMNAAWVQRVEVGLLQLQGRWGMALHMQYLVVRATCSHRRRGSDITTLRQAQVSQHGQRRGNRGTGSSAYAKNAQAGPLVSTSSGSGGKTRASHPPPGSSQTYKGSRKGRSSEGESKSVGTAFEELQLLKK